MTNSESPYRILYDKLTNQYTAQYKDKTSTKWDTYESAKEWIHRKMTKERLNGSL